MIYRSVPNFILTMSASDSILQAQSQGALIHSLSIIFVILSTLSVGLRLYTRSTVLKAIGADDVAIAIAQVLAIGVSVTTILGMMCRPLMN
jgi:hypothetical protein